MEEPGVGLGLPTGGPRAPALCPAPVPLVLFARGTKGESGRAELAPHPVQSLVSPSLLHERNVLPYRALRKPAKEVAGDPASVSINPLLFSSGLEGSEGEEGEDRLPNGHFYPQNVLCVFSP